MRVKFALLILSVSLSYVSLAATKDPTRPDVIVPKAAQKTTVRALKLTMIRTSDNGRHAVINGRSYAEGDRVGNYKIKSIGTSEVVLQNNKGTVRLSLITKGALRKKS